MTDTLSIWTVYDHPSDFPNNYVARRFEIGRGHHWPTDDMMIGPDVDAIRALLRRRGLTRLERDPDDEPQIMECWI